MRTFSLINRLGQKYTLMSSESGFFHSVSGLGYSDDTEYRRISVVYKMIEDHRSQDQIKGKVIFRQPNAQRSYQNFIKFLQLKPLSLVYIPEGSSELYYRRGTVTDVGYTETDCVQVSVTFTCWTPPFKYLNLVTYPTASAADGKVYDYTYDYTYRSTVANTVEIDIDTAMDCPCKITAYGLLVNPVWNHYVDGVLVATGKVNTTIPSNRKLVIDTETTPYSIKEYDMNNNLIADLYEQSDFGKKRFIMLKYGKNSIVITDDDASTTTVIVEAQVMYASV